MKKEEKKTKKVEEWTVDDTLATGRSGRLPCIIRIPHSDTVLWLSFSYFFAVLFFLFVFSCSSQPQRRGSVFTGKQMCQTFSAMIPSEMMVYDGFFFLFGF